jgi:hypothetical protein
VCAREGPKELKYEEMAIGVSGGKVPPEVLVGIAIPPGTVE